MSNGFHVLQREIISFFSAGNLQGKASAVAAAEASVASREEWPTTGSCKNKIPLDLVMEQIDPLLLVRTGLCRESSFNDMLPHHIVFMSLSYAFVCDDVPACLFRCFLTSVFLCPFGLVFLSVFLSFIV